MQESLILSKIIFHKKNLTLLNPTRLVIPISSCVPLTQRYLLVLDSLLLTSPSHQQHSSASQLLSANQNSSSAAHQFSANQNGSSYMTSGQPLTSQDYSLDAEINELQRENARVESQMLKLKTNIHAMETHLKNGDKVSD